MAGPRPGALPSAMRRSGRVILWVVVPFLALCVAGLWLTRARTAPVARPEPWLAPVTRAAPAAPGPSARAAPRAAPAPARVAGGASSAGADTSTVGAGTGGAGTAEPAPAPGPEVSAPPPDEAPQGSVAAADVRAAIQAVTPALRACFVAAARRHPGPQEVTVRFTVEAQGAGGRLSDGEIADSTLEDPLDLGCFLDALSRASFPAPRGGARVTVEVPLRFGPPDGDAGT